jgi:hypothetical protein
VAIFDVCRIVQMHELVNVCIGEVFCGIPRKHNLAVGAIDLLECHNVAYADLFLCVILVVSVLHKSNLGCLVINYLAPALYHGHDSLFAHFFDLLNRA